MKIVAGCIVRDGQGRYLLVQERQEKVFGLWNIPAGWADAGESAREAAMRETKEEVGLDVRADIEPIFQMEKPEKDRHYYAFLGHVVGGDLTIQESEILSAEWLSYDKIEELNDTAKIREPWIFEALRRAQNANSGD